MTDKTYKIIEQLAEKLNTSTDTLWAALIKQARIEFWCDILVLLILGLSATALLYTAYRIFKRNDGDLDEPGIYFLVFGGLLAIIFIVSFCLSLSEVAAAGYNPEFWALKQIIK